MWRRALLVWMLLIFAESVNGSVRQLVLVPAIGEHAAHQVGFMTASLLIWSIAALTALWLNADTSRRRLAVGALWLVLTLMFEAGLGLLLGYSREQMLADYDPRRGGLMLLAIPVLLLAPAIGARLRRAVTGRTMG